MTFTGTWRITAMEQWDQEAFDLMGPAFFRFDRGGTGHFRFIAVEGQMACRYSQREGRPFVEFSWEGNDECDPASGRGWARIEQDDTLHVQAYALPSLILGGNSDVADCAGGLSGGARRKTLLQKHLDSGLASPYILGGHHERRSES